MFVKRVSSRFFKQKTPTCWTQKKSSHLCTWPIHLQCEPASSYARLMQHAVVPPLNMLHSCLHPRGSKSAGHAFCPYHFATENNAVLSINAGIYARLAKVRPSVRISSNMLMYIMNVYVICECVQIVNVLICVLLIKSHVTM